MSMTLTRYQNNTLAAVKAYFERCAFESPETAYKTVTAEGDTRLRLGADYGYKSPNGMEDVPTVCIKVPTGGGKTILAAHSLKIIAEAQSKEYPFVLWFAPSDTIRKQTADAFKNVLHPYRQELDRQFEGRVKVFDLDEKFQILPEDIADNLCIVVSTVQAFVHEETGKYNVYRHNEDMERHFGGIALKNVMQPDDNPPVGILLCTEVGGETMEYVNAFIDPRLFVSKYQLQLPKRAEMTEFLKKENKANTTAQTQMKQRRRGRG